jgi:parallel beta-helix repeat protein
MKYLVVLLFLLLMASCQAKIITVNSGGSGDAKTLYDAISRAEAGDTLLIGPGSYGGAVVSKSISIRGSDQVTIKGSLELDAPGCVLSNLSIQGDGTNPAILLNSADNRLFRCFVKNAKTGIGIVGDNNTLQENTVDCGLGAELSGSRCKIINSTFLGDVGIKVSGGSQALVRGCEISSSQGVLMESARKNQIINNGFSGMGFGVALSASSENRIIGNNLSGAYVSGIDVVESSGNYLEQNRIAGGKLGISLRGSQNNSLIKNNCRKNERVGIYADRSFNNTLLENGLFENGNGILLTGSGRNLLQSNNASGNIYGVSLRGSVNNVLRKNIMRANSYNLRVDEGESSATPAASRYDFFIQDIDASNLADGRPICYLVKEKDLAVPPGCSYVGLVNCQNISVQNQSISNSSTGVLVVNSKNCRIENCSFLRDEAGVYLLDSTSLSLKGCSATGGETGFKSSGSSNALFEKNVARNCTKEGFYAASSLNLIWNDCIAEFCSGGFYLSSARLCNILKCSVRQSREMGIVLSNSHKCQLNGNEAYGNEKGISLSGSNACNISENNASENQRDGISLEQLSDAAVLGNIALRNGQGIFIQSSKNVQIAGNNLSDNNRYGLRMSSSSACNITDNSILGNQIAGANLVDCTGNCIYHNIFEANGMQNAADNGANRWDAGQNVGGNYWSDHKVQGNPSASPRPIPAKGVDHYPFQEPGGWR